jgi:hypothetical protein
MHRAEHPSRSTEAVAARSLLTARAVRTRSHRLLALGLKDELRHFRIDLDRLDHATALVAAATRAAYPTLDVPLHARFRHFVVAGEDRWSAVAAQRAWSDAAARTRAACDLAVVSVLLDAGAGARWRYRDALTGASLGGSEGLALASLALFSRGAFSSRPGDPLRADAAALQALSADTLRRGFQVSADNPLAGFEGRLALLRRLGAVTAAAPAIFARADDPRPGGLFDHFAALAVNGRIAASTILSELLVHLGPVWPARFVLGGVPLGDCWRHPALLTADATSGFVPFHKLSQWLAYSLIEPLEAAGLTVTDLDELTGLAEYRNGGLFVDSGVLVLREAAQAEQLHDVGSPLVVEWRALTVALLDHLAERLRASLNLDAARLPLAKVLQGGTWAAGRAIARALRADGSPPIKVASDGTVF